MKQIQFYKQFTFSWNETKACVEWSGSQGWIHFLSAEVSVELQVKWGKENGNEKNVFESSIRTSKLITNGIIHIVQISLFLKIKRVNMKSNINTISSESSCEVGITWSADFCWPGEELRWISLCWGESLFRCISACCASRAANCFSCWIRADTSCLSTYDKDRVIQLFLQ